ncbi:transposase [Ktedonobacter racemifer DSM 44963]|uniref:Transposase n=1 Tax=Ktedonobacter racemifer DSM 44963 TaxID=485913 RepID=D6TXI4_KTERA|nr:transposase [Ktedonobacter racemifer DSM 44963]
MRPLFALLLEVAHGLSNQEQREAEEVQKRFEEHLMRMRERAEQAEAGGSALVHFLKVTESYAPHLFYCYQVAAMPRTNNDLEQAFGYVRRSERRATGRKGTIPGLVVRGPVCVTAALATRLHLFTDKELVPHDLLAWHHLRKQIASRQQARRQQFRFRKDPTAYLAALEGRLSKMSLRS